MPLFAVEIPPGQYRNGTDLQAAGRWRDCSLVRWRNGALRPVGGWRETSLNTSGAARKLHTWRSNDGTVRLAVGHDDGLAVASLGDVVAQEATPADIVDGGFWTLDNFGENLVGCMNSDGRIFALEPGNSVAAPIDGAPINNAGVVVSDQRFVMAYGANGDPRNVAWCDREDYSTWTPEATNEAGSVQIATTGIIQAAASVGGEVLLLTDVDAHVGRYVGPQIVYEFERVAAGCGIIAPGSVAVTEAGAVWMGRGAFFGYQGGQVQQIPCEVADYVFSDLSEDWLQRVRAVPVADFSEVWWFYPSASALTPDRYVMLNTAEGTWATGQLQRTGGVDRGAWPYPVFGDENGRLYEHEIGEVPEGHPVYAETGPLSLAKGENTFTARWLYPDELTTGEVVARFKVRYYPNGKEYAYGPFKMYQPTGIRITGRQIRMRIEGVPGKDFRVGIPRLDLVERGMR